MVWNYTSNITAVSLFLLNAPVRTATHRHTSATMADPHVPATTPAPTRRLRKPLLYTIDYTTAKSQQDSSLCALPDELLLEIGKYCFDGFGLEF